MMRKFLSRWKYNLKPCRFFAKIDSKSKESHMTGWVVCEGGVVVVEYLKGKISNSFSSWIRWSLRFHFFGFGISLYWKWV